MQLLNQSRQIREGLSLLVAELESSIVEAKKRNSPTLVSYLEKCLKHTESALELSEVVLLSVEGEGS